MKNFSHINLELQRQDSVSGDGLNKTFSSYF